MKIDFFRVLGNFKNNNFVGDFIEEVSNYLERTKNKDSIDKGKKISLISENRIIIEKEKILEKYKNQPEKIEIEIIKMTNKILKEQNERLLKYRKEGHLYMVEEDINERIYLVDLSEKSGYSFEEVDFPKDLINKATEGAVFKYQNGEYTFFSNDGFERIYGTDDKVY